MQTQADGKRESASTDASQAPDESPSNRVAVGSFAFEADDEAQAHEGSTAPLVVLLLEDESSTRRAAAAALHLKGYRVIEARDAGEGVGALSAGNRVDVVFSDINMPGQMNGIAFARWVAAQHPDLPVLLTSAAPEYSLALDPSALRDFIGKPYELDEVDRRLRGML